MSPKTGQTEYEYKDLTIPLGIRVTPAQTRNYEGKTHAAAAAAAEPIIARTLAEARLERWEPEGSSSFLALETQGRVRYQEKYGAITGEWKYTDYLSVVIRLRRVAEPAR